MFKKQLLLDICKKNNFNLDVNIDFNDLKTLKTILPLDIYNDFINQLNLQTKIFDFDSCCVISKTIPDSLKLKNIEKIVPTKTKENDILNFLINNPNFEEELNLDPVESKMDLIFSILEKNKIVLIQGDTGCGKTTKIPRLLLKKYKNIVCTQPRRIAAISVAKRVADDLNTKIGDIVGYAVRFEDCTSNNTRLRFVTDGILLREISQFKNLDKYDCIIIDEAHERTINIDISLGFCKNILNKNCDIKIVIMSATLATDKFINFFNCPFVDIKYKKFSLQNYFLKEYITDDWFEETIKTIVQLEKTEQDGDILVFLTGQEEINEAHEILKEYIDISNCKFFTMYSSMPIEEQELVFEKYPIRKIILSTNVCETSITIENIKFVVDCGRVKQMRYSDNLGMSILETVMISKAQARQRSGRAGRTEPGKVFRIFTMEEYNNMIETSIPEILTTDVSSGILTIQSLGIGDIKTFPLIDKPKIEAINNALEFLYLLKAVDALGNITDLGKNIAKIPLYPSLALSLIKSINLGCFDDVAIISAMLTVEQIFNDIKNNNKLYRKFDFIKKSWYDSRGDFFMMLKIFKKWEENHFSYKFLKMNFLNIKNMWQAKKIREQLSKIFNKRKFSNESKVLEAFCCGYFMNIAKITQDGYTTIFKDTNCFIHSSSCLYKKNAKYVLYFSILRTRKEYLRYCNVVTPEILCKSVNHVFNKKN